MAVWPSLRLMETSRIVTSGSWYSSATTGPGSAPGAKRRITVPRPRASRDRIVERAMRPPAAGAPPVRGSGGERLGLRVGDDVVHGKWGEGIVIDITGEGDKAEATVRFPSVGEKQLLLAWAPLKRA